MSPENSKPEWFQMTEGDPVAPKPVSKKVVRAMALAAPLLVLGAGLVFAQTQDSSTAVASASLPSPAASTATTALSSNTPSPAPATPATSTAPPVQAIAVSQSSGATLPQKSSISRPGITKPTGGGEDDGFEVESNDD